MGMIRWHHILSLLVAVALTTSASGQDFRKQYRQAKDLFLAGNYSESMKAFQPLTIYDRENPYPEYASYYYAMSAYRLGFAAVAKDMLLQIRKLYPSWDQLAEANFLLAAVYSEKGEVFQALLVLSEIQKPTLVPDVLNLKRTLLANVNDTETLKMVLEEYPQDTVVARALAKNIVKRSWPAEARYFDSLLLQFNFPRHQFPLPAGIATVRKEKYRVSVILPIQLTTLEPSPNRKRNQNVIDLYQGMVLAADTLTKQGKSIDLLLYDSERNPESVKKLLEKPELKETDCLVGPLFTEDAKPVLEFSQQHKINLFANPVSNSSDFLNGSDHAFLFEPSHETIGRKSAELIYSHRPTKPVIVFYGENPRDIMMAGSFNERARELGLRVLATEMIRKEAYSRVTSVLATPTEYDEFKKPKQFKLRLDSLGSVMVCSDDPLIFSKAVNAVELRNDKVLVIGRESWLEDQSVALSLYEKIGAVFSSPNFTPLSNPALLHFQKKYTQRHAVFPSSYAQIGYEFMMFLGTMLHQHGTHFEQTWQPLPGTMSEGYVPQPSRDNALVPFIILQQGQPILFEKR
jgi:hypothetical protein